MEGVQFQLTSSRCNLTEGICWTVFYKCSSFCPLLLLSIVLEVTYKTIFIIVYLSMCCQVFVMQFIYECLPTAMQCFKACFIVKLEIR